jgi:hypothetical protein
MARYNPRPVSILMIVIVALLAYKVLTTRENRIPPLDTKTNDTITSPLNQAPTEDNGREVKNAAHT